MNYMQVQRSINLLIFFLVLNSCDKPLKYTFESDFPEQQRTWIGSDYWANPLQDWEVKDGKLSCLKSAQDRSVSLLTYDISQEAGGDLFLEVKLNLTEQMLTKYGYAAFRVGAKGPFDDYRSHAVFGKGIDFGVTANGVLFVGKPNLATNPVLRVKQAYVNEYVKLRLEVAPNGSYLLKLVNQGNKDLSSISGAIQGDDLVGNLMLVSHFDKDFAGQTVAGEGFQFSDLKMKGSLLNHHPDRAFGPILFAQYTLSRNILKLTAQLAPISSKEGKRVALEIKNGDRWEEAGEATIDEMSRTAHFRLENWDSKNAKPYRLIYKETFGESASRIQHYGGTIQKEPDADTPITVAAFTGNSDLGFPNNEVVSNVMAHKPDLLFFSGDQLYESVGRYGVQRSPVDKSTLDYLRKWYIYGWEYGEMLRNLPTVSITDDHDVYHGNIWGESGKATTKEGNGNKQQDSGGYKQPPEWVKMVERTQTSHLPDPFDPTPVKQGIGVYYTDLLYGGVSFAILEDRKFKSAPNQFFPKDALAENGWVQNHKYRNAKFFDTPGELLGDRQKVFLEHWAADWEGVEMKAVLSQTIFSTVATLPDSAISDVIVPKLRIMKPGDYPENDRPTQDMDSNGWPKKERNASLEILQKAFAFHVAGDQHLGSTIQYGVDDYGDAGFALCVPSISNYWPRRWMPKVEGQNRKLGAPKYTGDYLDGFGNKMTVHAVSNPTFTGLEPAFLYDRAAGYGIIKIDKQERTVEFSNWPRNVDPRKAESKPYTGWPILFKQTDNFALKGGYSLPEVKIEVGDEPVLKIWDDQGVLVLGLRLNGQNFVPKVKLPGSYKMELIGVDGEELWSKVVKIKL